MRRRYKGRTYYAISLNRLFLLILFTLSICLSITQTTPVFAGDVLYETVVDVPVITAEWSPDGSLLAVGTTTGAIIYNQELQEIETLPNANERIVSLSWEPTSSRLAGVLYPHDHLEDPVVPPTMVSSLLI